MIISKKTKEEILKIIKPNKFEEKRIKTIVGNFIEKLEASKKKLNLKCDFIIGGSFGKNTFLKKDFDVDIFARFDFDSKKENENKISFFLEKILTISNFKFKKLKGSRDYFQVNYNKVLFEIVPTIKIKNPNQALNTTDISYLHVEFVNENSKANPVLCDEIRLAKQFFKSKELYGAESYIGGFSGHVIDLLIIYYKSFENLIEGIKNWKEKQIIDIKNYYKDEKEVLEKINSDKISNLILIDPIIKNRNAARSLNSENYFKAILMAKTIEKLSSKDFIIKKNSIIKEINNQKKFAKKYNLNPIIYKIIIEHNSQSKDIIGSKLLKILKNIKKYFEEKGHSVFSYKMIFNYDKKICVFILLLELKTPLNFKEIIGPKIYMDINWKKFLENKEYYKIKNQRVVAYEKEMKMPIEKLINIKKKDLSKFINKNIDFILKFELEK